MEKIVFQNKLRAYKRNSKAGMALALELAQASIELFAAHGQLAYANAFLQSMPDNYGRKPAFVAWMRKFSPAAIRTKTDDKGKNVLVAGKTVQEFYKVKGENAVAFNVEGAAKVKFWDLVPEPVQQEITETAIVRRLDSYRRQLLKAMDAKEHGVKGAKISDKAEDLVPSINAFVKELADKAGVELKPDTDNKAVAEEHPADQVEVIEPDIDMSEPTDAEIEEATKVA